ncbi:hypothetical protein [Paenibacillus sp. PL2-23]|uniref:hypothetical protein n=1 Tax=Paenibacillus sp. PL2-23 TaxID=2100729 RepID=UPI0030F6782D
MSEQLQSEQERHAAAEGQYEGRDVYDMDIDRMVNEGLGGGQVTIHNGLIAESTTDSMVEKPEGE